MLDTQEPMIWFGMQALKQSASLARNVLTDMGTGHITKSDLSPVTVADYAIQALVGQALKKTFPDDVLVGEESANDLKEEKNIAILDAVTLHTAKIVPGATPDDVCKWIDYGTSEPGERFWTLDPVDGTKGFLRGGQFAIALALIERGEVVLGFLGCPNLNTKCEEEIGGEGALLIAQQGKGTWITSLGASSAELVPLNVSTIDKPKHARLMRSVESGHTNVGEIDHIASHLATVADPVQMDSQAKYAVLAAGGGEILLRLLSPGKETYKERIWDQAAGSIILEEAGGKITDLYGKSLDFGQGRMLAKNTGVFASNGALHKAGLEAISTVSKLP